jgi:hypothetical protein
MSESSDQRFFLAKGVFPFALFLFLSVNTLAQAKFQIALSLNKTYQEHHFFSINNFIFYNSAGGESAPFSIGYRFKEFTFMNRPGYLTGGLELNRISSSHTVAKVTNDPDAPVGGSHGVFNMRELALPIHANVQVRGILHFVTGVSYSYMVGSQKLIGFDRNSIINNYWTNEEYEEAKSALQGIVQQSVFSYQLGGALVYKRFSFTLLLRKSISNAFGDTIDFQGKQLQPFIRYTTAITKIAYNFPIKKKK